MLQTVTSPNSQTALMVSRVPFLKNPEKEKALLIRRMLKSSPSAPGNRKIEIRDTAILVLLYDSAIRLSELLSLKLTDVNLKNTTPYLRIHGKGDKERIVSISEGTVKHLKNYIKLFQ